MSTRHPIRACRNCQKPFFKTSPRKRYCTIECRREASNFFERCRNAERNLDARFPLPEDWNTVPREARPPKTAAKPRAQHPPRPPKKKGVYRKGRVPFDIGPEARMKRRAEWQEIYETVVVVVNQIKMERGCVDCGYRGHPTALQFDHVRGEKIRVVSSIHNLKDALAEIEKCEVRCANCHSIRTWRWKQELRKEKIARDLTLLAEMGKA